MQKITPCLWFDNNIEEAIEFYSGIFKNFKVVISSKLPDQTNMLTAIFEIEGQQFMGLNGGPGHPFTDAISLTVNCDTQQEIDHYWDSLTANGGSEVQCGWLKDKFGLSWQITPTIVFQMLADPDAEKALRVMDVVMKSIKLNITELKAAYEG
ncbi:MAG: VOC family protein [Mucilaginibacter sp.]|uniref:VOC family protein n=1 Tax=Mucilaginibacter sp. TaxID=1882438 RepID=UPI0032633B7F